MNEFLESGQLLGQLLGQPPAEAAEAPEQAELLLAAYLEGRLDEAETARVEAWLASDAEALALMLDSRAALEAPAEPVPAALLDRAKELAAPAFAASPAPAETLERPEEAELLLAAYLEGGLDEAEAARVEAWLAADPEALALMLASRDALQAPAAEAVPAALLDRARGAVRPTPRGAAAPRQSWLQAVFGSFGGRLQPVGVAAAVALACALGIGLGHSSFANLTAAQALEAEGVDLGLTGDGIF